MKRVKNILVVGNFGLRSGQLDGQTVKTRSVRELAERFGRGQYAVRHFDTDDFKERKLSVFRLLRDAAWCDTAVIVPARKSLTYLFPTLWLLSRLMRFGLVHIAVGSRQAEFFRNKVWFRSTCLRMARHSKAFFVEGGKVKSELEREFGFRNARFLPNFRVHAPLPEVANRNEGLKLVFLSRVMPEKGTAMLFRIGDHLAGRYPSGEVSIDVYGQIAKGCEWFPAKAAAAPCIEYRGPLAPEDIHGTLARYDMLLLPTQFYTEGFPGALLDAYIAGIPVAVSRWAYAEEFVRDGVTGFICGSDNTQAFCRAIDRLFDDRERLLAMKRAAREESQKYAPEKVWEILKPFL